MSFFTDIDGKSGENLVSAIFQYLLQRSPDMRRAAIGLISARSPLGRVKLLGRFGSHPEVFVEGDGDTDGRVDLLLETDNAVIGVENKLLADFQMGQPGKYFSAIRNRADRLKDVFGGSEYHALLVVLFPESQKTLVQSRLSDPLYLSADLQDKVIRISWQELLAAMKCVEPADVVATFLLHQLDQYVREATGSLSQLGEVFHCVKRIPTNENVAEQKFLVGQLQRFFVHDGAPPYKTKMWGSPNRYFGYRFLTIGKFMGWFGFVSSDGIKGFKDKRASELVVTTNFDVALDEKWFEHVDYVKWSPGYDRYWVVKFDPDWVEASLWVERLRPMHLAIQRMIDEGAKEVKS